MCGGPNTGRTDGAGSLSLVGGAQQMTRWFNDLPLLWKLLSGFGAGMTWASALLRWGTPS